jgi:hypothetical protein
MEFASCNNLVYWGQKSGTCWFNALLMAMFYSQDSRKMLQSKLKSGWMIKRKGSRSASLSPQNILYNCFSHVLDNDLTSDLHNEIFNITSEIQNKINMTYEKFANIQSIQHC